MRIILHCASRVVNVFQRIKNLSVEKETLSIVPGFELGFFDCRLIAPINRVTQAFNLLFSTGRPRYIA